MNWRRSKAFMEGGRQSPRHKPGGGSRGTGAPPPPPEPTVLRREDYIAPAGTVVGKPRSLRLRRKKKPADAPAEAPRRGETSNSDYSRGQSAEVTQPTALRFPTTKPAPQKPDIKLPLDAIRASKVGRREAVASTHAEGRSARKADVEAAQPPAAKALRVATAAPAWVAQVRAVVAECPCLRRRGRNSPAAKRSRGPVKPGAGKGPWRYQRPDDARATSTRPQEEDR